MGDGWIELILDVDDINCSCISCDPRCILPGTLELKTDSGFSESIDRELHVGCFVRCVVDGERWRWAAMLCSFLAKTFHDKMAGINCTKAIYITCKQTNHKSKHLHHCCGLFDSSANKQRVVVLKMDVFPFETILSLYREKRRSATVVEYQQR